MDANPSDLPDNARFERAKNTSWSRLGDEVLVLDMATRRSHRLTGAAVVIWDGVLEGSTVSEIIEAMTSTFEVDAPTASHDTQSTLQLLLAEAVICEMVG